MARLESDHAKGSLPLQHASLAPGGPRPVVAGCDRGPETPFPIRLKGRVERGFGRGSKELGCPTANLPSSLAQHPDLTRNGVYYGWACLDLGLAKEMVMSVGLNPVYANQTRTMEVHLLHHVGTDFYGQELRIIVLGFIRPEYNYTSKEELIKDIEIDKSVALASLRRPTYLPFSTDEFLRSIETP